MYQYDDTLKTDPATGKLLLGNPRECFSVVNTKTLIVSAELSPAGTKTKDGSFEKTHPLKIYSGFSRFVLTLIDSQKENVFGNIKPGEVADIIDRSGYAKKLHFDSLWDQKKEASDVASSPAFTVKLPMGKLKGMSPGEALAGSEDPEATIDYLRSSWKWLSENKDPKYVKKNREQMDAITLAVSLFRDGKIDRSSCPVTIPLYDGGFRPLRSKKQLGTKTFVYEVKILWHVSADRPVEVVIKNYYAPVTQKEDGRLNVQAKEAEALKSVSMSLSTAEWADCLRRMSLCMEHFEMLHSRDAFRAADRLAIQARKEYEDTISYS